jgi:hypothetical protein
MTSGPAGLKIDWFETQPSPGFDRLAPASQGRESKMLFHQRNKKAVAGMTQNRHRAIIPLRLQPPALRVQARRISSLAPRQLAASPALFLPRGIEHPFDVPVQSPHDADARKHRQAADLDHGARIWNVWPVGPRGWSGPACANWTHRTPGSSLRARTGVGGHFPLGTSIPGSVSFVH